MGQIVKQAGDGSTKYYWYPGDRKEWRRGLASLGLGIAAFLLVFWLTRNRLFAMVGATVIVAGSAGFNIGRRDARGVTGFPNLSAKAAKRAAVLHAGRAAWRGTVLGLGLALAAVLIANLNAGGLLANWLLPLAPAVVGALSHQLGMMAERLVESRSTAGPAADQPAGTVRADVKDERFARVSHAQTFHNRHPKPKPAKAS